MKKLLGNKTVSWLFKIIITVIFVFIVNKSITRNEIVVITGYLSIQHILFAVLFGFAGLFFQVKRWEIILRYQKFNVKGHVAWKTILWGNLLAFITPGRIGELFRGLKIEEGRKGDSLFAVIIDKLFIIMTVLLAGFLCVIFQLFILKVGITDKMKIFLVSAFILCVIGFALLSTGKVFDKSHAVSRYFNRILTNLPRLFTPAGKKALLYSFIAHFCLIAQTVTLLHMFGCGTFIINSIAIGQAYGIMPFLSFTIGNMGVREGSFYLFLTYLGAACDTSMLSLKAASLGTSILILLMNIIVPAFVGLLWYLSDTSINKKTSGSR